MGSSGLRASLGAGLSLVIAGVLVLVLLTTVVAFHGTVGDVDGQVAQIRLPDAPPAREAGASVLETIAAAPAVRAARERPAERRPVVRRTRSGARQRLLAEYVERGSARSAPQRQTTAPAPAATPAPVGTPAPEPTVVRDVTRTVEDVLDPVAGVTEQVGDDVDRVADGLLP